MPLITNCLSVGPNIVTIWMMKFFVHFNPIYVWPLNKGQSPARGTEIASPLPRGFFRWSMQVERKLEDLGVVKSYRTIYGRQQIGIRPVVSSWGTINGWLRTINTIHKQFRPFDRINTRVNVAGKALHGLVHAFFFDLLFGWRLWLWVELKKGVSLNILHIEFGWRWDLIPSHEKVIHLIK